MHLGGEMTAVTLTEAGAVYSTIGSFDAAPAKPSPDQRRKHGKRR